jgi:thiol-disulfide isomerase/thioredoxin/outer membrane lipoprotein-sorting protein
MRFMVLIGVIFIALNADAQASASKLWSDLKAKREALPSFHQEFEVTQTFKTKRSTQSSHRDIVIDMSQSKWRERSVSGSGDRIRIFDGQDLFLMEADGNEYVQTKHKSKQEDPEPGPYGSVDLDWEKAKEVERRPCGYSGSDHTCIVVDVPVKKWMRVGTGNQITRSSGGMTRMAIDSETGMLVQSNTQEAIDNQQGGYVLDLAYTLKKMTYSGRAVPDEALFKLPESGMHKVKELTPWNAARIKEQLVGKPAPELEVTDIQENPLSLSDLRGKTVLLDFWTTWCPPCLSDAPVLDSLYRKYGGKELMIIGISVSEEREVVEKFLKSHPHGFPVVLTSENEMPRPYEIGTFPTYIVIAPDGTLTTAVEGDQGFGELRKVLEKAGMEPD